MGSAISAYIVGLLGVVFLPARKVQKNARKEPEFGGFFAKNLYFCYLMKALKI
jgi:hypothetical protein